MVIYYSNLPLKNTRKKEKKKMGVLHIIKFPYNWGACSSVAQGQGVAHPIVNPDPLHAQWVGRSMIESITYL
jgi:hypothetical protein